MNELRQRQPRVRNEPFLRYIRTLRCIACHRPPPSHAAHIRMGSPAYEKRSTGAGERPSDCWATPLCERCHIGEQHAMGERIFWEQHKIDPFAVAKNLYAEFERTKGKS